MRVHDGAPAVVSGVSVVPGEPEEVGALAVAVGAMPTDDDERPPSREGAESGAWPDETAEAAFLTEARNRGEVLAPARAREEIAEETDARPLPALDELVQRIPSEVREALDDLFRARFVRVARVPKNALKE